MSTEATKKPKKPGPTATFDASGKFIPSPRGNYGETMKALIEQYNNLVDASALLWDPEVIKWLLEGDNATDKPSAIQNAANGIRQLIDQRLEEASNNARQGAEATLEALRTKLAEEHAKALAALHEEYDQRRTGASQEYIAALGDKDAQIAMRDRLDVYTADVYNAVNAFIKLFGASLGVRTGIHPLNTTTIRGDVLRKQFQISSFEFTLVTARPDVAGYLRDTLTVGTAADSDMPKLVSTQLELRSNPLTPGLSDKGRDTLDGILRKLTPNWFQETAPHLTDEELNRIFRDPQAARRYFDTKQRRRTGGVDMVSIIDLGQDHEHNGEGPGGCPACNGSLSSVLNLLGVESGTGGFDYISGPFGPHLRKRTGGFGSHQNRTPGPQADPYHYDSKE